MNPPREHLTTLDDWLTWKAKCSIAGCPKDTAVRLARFGRNRLKAALYQLDNPDSPPRIDLDSGDEAALDISHWLRVEAFLLAGHAAIEGPVPAKRYKDRLLEYAGASRNAFEGCMTRMIQRDICRRLSYEEGDHIRGKDGLVNAYCASRDDVDRQADIEAKLENQVASSRDLIPSHLADPATKADQKEVERLARQALSTFIRSLSRDDRIILVFALLNVSQCVAIQNKLIHVQKSSASEKLQGVRRRISNLEWPFEPDPAEKRVLLRAFAAALYEWAEGPENADLARFTQRAEKPL